MRVSGTRAVVTGAAGFIGSHLVDELLSVGCDVVGIDNLSAGREEFLSDAMGDDRFELVRMDLLGDDIADVLEGADVVFHLAANPDVRSAAGDTRGHFDQNIAVTYRVLEACVASGVRDIVFSSTSTVYGETDVIPTPEEHGPLLPISIYGAAKLAGEALISSYCHTFDMRAVIYRFANVVGDRSTHNVLHDFVRKLREDPTSLEILGAEPGTNKSYVHVDDCVRAMVVGAEAAEDDIAIYNIGTRDWTFVKEIADIVTEEMGLKDVEYRWTGGTKGGRGWVGDVRTMLLATDRIEAAGWAPEHGSSDAIRAAVRSIIG